MGMSEDTHQRILSKWGIDYFKNIPIEIFQCGDELTQINNEKVLLLHTLAMTKGN